MKRSLAVIVLFLPFMFGGYFTGHAKDEGQTKSKRGWLGVSTRDMTPKLARSMNVKTSEGALVQIVMEDSPAEEAGIKENDIIVDFNGNKISDSDDLLDAVRKTKPGTPVSIQVSRKDEQKSLKATLDKTPTYFAAPFAPHVPAVPHMRITPPRFAMSGSSNVYGLRMRELNKQLGLYFGAPDGRGVLVEEVEEGSPADSAGFMAGDVIVKIQNHEVAHAHDVWDVLDDMKDGETATVEVIRKGNSQKLSLRVDESVHQGMRFHSQSFEVPHFNSREFRREMEQLQQELRKMGKEIESRSHEWKEKLREELNHVTT